MKKIITLSAALILAVGAAGCQISNTTRDEIINQGREIFKNKCVACHAINGQGGQKGPDLSKIGIAHDKAWIKSYLENPYSVKPDSTMPQVSLTAGEIDKLTIFLSSLK